MRRVFRHPDGGRQRGDSKPALAGGPKAPTFSTSDTQAFKRAIDMTDDELAAIASRAHLTVVK